jgi:hypothetical protein
MIVDEVDRGGEYLVLNIFDRFGIRFREGAPPPLVSARAGRSCLRPSSRRLSVIALRVCATSMPVVTLPSIDCAAQPAVDHLAHPSKTLRMRRSGRAVVAFLSVFVGHAAQYDYRRTGVRPAAENPNLKALF